MLDFCGGLVAAVQREYGVGLTVDDITKWDLHPLLDPIIGRSFWAWLRDRDWLWANFPAVPGAIGSLDRLRRDGNYLECVTSKPEWAEHSVWKWLGLWRPPFHRVTIVGMDDSKADATDAQILVDDKLKNCTDFVKSGRQAILFSRPHNLKDKVSVDGRGRGVYRAEDWRSVMALVGMIP